MIGIDDSNPDTLKVMPRIPSSWKGYSASGWPVYTRNGVSYLDIKYERKGDDITLKMKSSLPIKVIQVRFPSHKGWRWISDEACSKLNIRFNYFTN
jgi:hypothetical protein